MILKHFDLANSFIKYNNITLDFSNNGIYLLEGANGTGKTSIIEKIVYDDCDIEFENDIYYKIYKKERYLLFSYVSQTIDDVDDSLFGYITKCNKSIKKEQIYHYMKELYMDDITLHQPFNSLSGGERIKASIISALLKNTTYLFLDEPTNYLDDKSVKALINILKEYSFTCKIIVVSHDPRFSDLTDKKIFIDGHNITTNYLNSKQEKQNNNFIPFRINLLKVILFKSNKLSTYLILFSMLCCLLFLSFFLQIKYSTNYLNTDLPEKNQILVYDAEKYFGVSNQLYCEWENINIKDINLANILSYSNIEYIYNNDNVKNIYMLDYQKCCYYNEFINNYSIDNLELLSFSMPQRFYTNNIIFNNMGVYAREYNYICGTYPQDNKNEIVISKNIYDYYFKTNYDNLCDLIGTYITLNEKEYKICGITEFNACLTSYSEDINNGCYTYDKDTYQEFINSQKDFIKDNNFYYDNARPMVIETYNNKEKEVLNWLIQNYPANNYFSYVYAIARDKQSNKIFEKRVVILLMPSVLLLGFIFYLLQKQNIKVNSNRIKNYYRFYNTKKIKVYYIIYNELLYFIIASIVIIFNLVINDYSYVLLFMIDKLLLSIFIILIQSLLYSIYYSIKYIRLSDIVIN